MNYPVHETIELVTHYYGEQYPPVLKKGVTSYYKRMLVLLLLEINSLKSREIQDLTGIKSNRVNDLRRKAEKGLIKNTVFKKEYLVLSEIIKQKNDQRIFAKK